MTMIQCDHTETQTDRQTVTFTHCKAVSPGCHWIPVACASPLKKLGRKPETLVGDVLPTVNE